MANPIILLSGAAGDLGARILKALIQRGAVVRALVRTSASPADRDKLTSWGATVALADVNNAGSVAAACEGAACVVSALNGLREVIVVRQGVLLEAAVSARVPRFISSDYSVDFTKTKPGENRNLDLRREFMALADRRPIRTTSILNGAFLDMLGREMPIIQPSIRRVLYWGDGNQPLDFTTKDNVARYTAEVALDDTSPRILRIAGSTVTVREIAEAMSQATGERFRTMRLGGIGVLSILIRLAKLIAPQPKATFPPWQGMQYLRDMFSGRGKLHPLDNDRYAGLVWTSVLEHLSRQQRVHTD